MLLLFTLLASSCAAVDRYSVRRAENACAAFDRCTVYDGVGPHEVACFQPGWEGPTVFAGDPDWPLSDAVCRSPAQRS
jgi:hypothetical protein